jgi:hypothetical protein
MVRTPLERKTTMLTVTTDIIIRELLKSKPEHLWITPDGSALYVLVPDEFETVLEFTGPDFTTMTDEDINQYIVDTLNKINS